MGECVTTGGGISSSVIARIQAPELVSVYIDVKRRLEQARSSMARLMSKSQVLDQHLSDIAWLLSLPESTDQPQASNEADSGRVESGSLTPCTPFTGSSSDIALEAGGDALGIMPVPELEPDQAEAVGGVLLLPGSPSPGECI